MVNDFVWLLLADKAELSKNNISAIMYSSNFPIFRLSYSISFAICKARREGKDAAKDELESVLN